MSEEIKEILNKFDGVLKNYELDKAFGQLSVDSICHLFPSEIITIKNYIQQKENIIKEAREYIENNWISKKDADNYRFDDEELDIEISDIAVLFDILNKGE